jgi:hypothetical protein
MGTRGAVGIRYNNEDKVGFNPFSSYPKGLGQEILIWLNQCNERYLQDFFKEINTESNEDVWDWKLHCMRKSFKLDNRFLIDSLFCEWAYIINLDSGKLEIYHGFNHDPDAPGRYAKESIPREWPKNMVIVDENGKATPFEYNPKPYYGVVLDQEIPLSDINKYILIEKKII